MSIPFPLYDKLVASITTGLPDWKNLSVVINNLDPVHCEIIFVLIIHHFVQEQTAKTGIIKTKKEISNPYGGKILEGGKGLLYTANNLPPILQQIIYEYIKTIQ